MVFFFSFFSFYDNVFYCFPFCCAFLYLFLFVYFLWIFHLPILNVLLFCACLCHSGACLALNYFSSGILCNGNLSLNLKEGCLFIIYLCIETKNVVWFFFFIFFLCVIAHIYLRSKWRIVSNSKFLLNYFILIFIILISYFLFCFILFFFFLNF
jgi:hypothetical protein